jgi:hypothetical protein
MFGNRRHKRITTHNLLSYVCLDEDGSPLDQGVGSTLDISQGGLLMGTSEPVHSKFLKLTFIDTQNELVNIKARTIYCIEKKPKNFLVGICFIESTKRINKIMEEMIKSFTDFNNDIT